MRPGLLATKLRRPAAPPKQVPRPQLIQRLNAGLESGRQLTLVSAPAGYGKTTCVSAWLDGLDGWPVTWLSLDAADDDPGRFFTYFVAALQQIEPRLGREIEALLRAGQLPPDEVISTALSNAILALERPFLLVLDDFQVIQDPFILQVLERLLANPPPALFLVLVTREDPSLPLARLRARNQLAEIRASDLRFSALEAGRFLNDVLGAALSEADVAALARRTEGWAAGLQLAGLSMYGRADPSRFIARLSGSHRYILGYLTAEVLDRQPEATRQFLLHTSILERLNGELCDAVTGRDDGAATLERLFNANLFLTPLDDEGRWYRYHRLFADLLRDRQGQRDPAQVARLHRRAAHWYAEASAHTVPGLGEWGTRVSEAVRHALAAPDYALALQLIETHALDMLMQWYRPAVQAWIEALPAEWRARSPRANLAFAWTHLLLRGDPLQAAPYLERLREIFAGPGVVADDALQAEWLALQATLLNAQGRPAESLRLAKRALAIAPEQEAYVRGLIYMGLAGAHQGLDNYPRLVDSYQQIIRHGRAAASLIVEMMGVSGLALAALDRGQLHFAFEIASQGVERMTRAGALPPISGAVYGELGEVHYQWHQLKEARRYFQRAAELSHLSGFSDAEVYHAVIRSRLAQMEGDLAAAGRALQQAVTLSRDVPPAAVREQLVAQQVRVYLAQNRPTAAETALQGQGFVEKDPEGAFAVPDLAPDQAINANTGLLYNSALRILLYRAQVLGDAASLGRGIALAGRVIDAALGRGYLPIALEALLLRARLHATAETRSSRSRADCVRALELAQPQEFITPFVAEGPAMARALADLLVQSEPGAVLAAYLRRILDACGAAHPQDATPDQSGLVEPLTERELEVLRLMAAGLKYKEIAAALFISLNTVRTHVKAIYGKLAVNNRTKAIQRAAEMQLL